MAAVPTIVALKSKLINSRAWMPKGADSANQSNDAFLGKLQAYGKEFFIVPSRELIRMDLRRLLHAIVLLPAQIVRTARRVIYRIMSYNRWLKHLFAAWEHLRWLCVT